MYKLCIGSMVTFLLILPPFFFYYIIIPFATDPNQMLGPSTFVITLLMSIIGYIAMIPMFILTSCQTLIDQVSLVHISTIKTYLEKVRVIIMNNNNNFIFGNCRWRLWYWANCGMCYYLSLCMVAGW